MLRTVLALVLMVSTMAWAGPQGVSPMTIHGLTCEFLVNPLGVDSLRPRLGWKLDASAALRNQRQSGYRILVASSEKMLADNVGDLWDSGKVESAQQNNVPYMGSRLKSGQACFWKVQVWDGAAKASAWSETARWEMGLLSLADWGAEWINDGKSNPAKDEDFYKEDPAPLFRKEFRVRGAVKRARLYVTGLGYYEARLNGEKVGDHVLDPGWTAFEKRVYYSTYDVKSMLEQGANCVGVTVGNGWYNPLPMRMWGNRNIRESVATGRPRFIARMVVEYEDGQVETVVSDRSWKVGNGPILRNNVYLGEVVDARKEEEGWDSAGFDDAGWRTPAVATEKVGALVAQPLPPIRVTGKWKAVKVTKPQSGTYVYDMGVNFAGWVQLGLDVPRGTVVKVRFGELLRGDGMVNPMTSVAGQIKSAGVGGPGSPDVAEQVHTYIAKGGGETFMPKFSFHGFRYVEVTGVQEPLELDQVVALRLNSDVKQVGRFECSNPMLNQIQAMCERTFLSNIFSVQSDCPHREKFGYGGDIGSTSDALMANYDMSTFYAKAVKDWSDSALANGVFTDTAPSVGIQYCGVGWALAHPLLVTQLRQYYGNSRLNEEEYEAAKKWLLEVEKQTPDGIVQGGLSDHEGLEPAPAPAMVTPLYFMSAKMLAEMADELGKTEDRTYFLALADSIREAYLKQFVDSETGKVGPGSQASQAFGLATGIVPDEMRSKVMDFLVKEIAGDKNHLSTGIYGTKYLLDELSADGKADLAYEIVTQKDFPGWGWMMENGATTLWEHWEFSDNTFSHNHPMFGSVSEWMMQWLGGIQPAEDALGYDRVVIRPQMVDGLDWVKSSYDSVRGKVVSNWVRGNTISEFEITIPPNMEAKVYLPAKSLEQVREWSFPLERVKGIKWMDKHDSSTVVLTIGSGFYQFYVHRD